MKINLLLIIIALLQSYYSLGQNGNYSLGARSAAVGGAAVTLGDAWALYNNIGGLSNYRHKSIVTSIRNKFGISQLTALGLACIYPTEAGTAGLGFFRFGDDIYNEQKINLGYSHQLGIVSLGLNLGYYQLIIEGLGNRKTILIDFGGRATLTDQLVFGGHVSNINQAKLSTITKEKIPIIMKSGICYRPRKELMINLEIQKQIDQQAIFKVGMEYEMLENLWLRTGFHTMPFEGSFGFGIHPGLLEIDYAYSNNTYLGSIHEFSLAYKFSS